METPTVQNEQSENTKSGITDEEVEEIRAKIWQEIIEKAIKDENRYTQFVNRLKAEVEIYEKRKLLYVIPSILWGMLAGIAVGYIFLAMLLDGLSIKISLAFFLSFLGCGAILGGFCAFLMKEGGISEKIKTIREYDLSHEQDKTEEDPFQNSIKTSYKYLDRYYDQTQRQAQQGFGITVVIAVFGALLIFGGVIAMYFGFIQPAYITCASGAITELISAIFFYLYNKTVTSMSRYHNKLVLSQNISFALRVADSLTEKKKDAAKLEIIKELMKDVNAQMMKSDADDTEPSKKKPSPDAETPSGNE